MIEERHFINIFSDIKIAKKRYDNLKWTPEELAIDMKVVVNQLIIDLDKFLSSGTDASAKRIRSDSKILETLGKSFRVRSINNHL